MPHMLATKRSAGVTPEVNLRECVTHMPLYSSNKAAHCGFETQRRRHQKSDTGVSVAPQKGLMSSKFEKKKKIVVKGHSHSISKATVNVSFAKKSHFNVVIKNSTEILQRHKTLRLITWPFCLITWYCLRRVNIEHISVTEESSSFT